MLQTKDFNELYNLSHRLSGYQRSELDRQYDSIDNNNKRSIAILVDDGIYFVSIEGAYNAETNSLVFRAFIFEDICNQWISPGGWYIYLSESEASDFLRRSGETTFASFEYSDWVKYFSGGNVK